MNTRRSKTPAVKPKGASKPKAEEIEIQVTHDGLSIGSTLIAALQESETRYRLLADNVNDVIWAGDLNLRHIYVSPSITRLTGYSVEEFMTKRMDEILTPKSSESAKKALAEELAAQETGGNNWQRSRIIELEVKCKDGSTVWVEAKMAFLRDSVGHPVGVLGVVWDITERRRMEQELRESEARLHTVFDSIRDGIVVVDLEGHIVEVNKAALLITGYDKRELIGRSAFELIAPDDRVSAIEALRQALEKGSRQEVLTYTVLAANGRMFEAEFSGALMRDAHGNPSGFVGVMRDITERRQGEEALLQSERKFKELAESITDVFFAMDEELRYTYWNSASEELTGVWAENAVGKHLYDIFPDSEETRRAERVYREALRTKKPQHFVNEYHLRGQDFVFEISAYPTESGLSVFVKNITENKRAEEALKESERRYRLLAENVTDVIWKVYIDSPTRLNYISPSVTHLLGYTVDEAMNKTMEEVFTPVSFENAMRALAEEMAGIGEEPVDQHRSRTLELELKRKDGSLVVVETIHTLIRSADGQPLEILTVARDITERKRAEEEKEQLSAQLIQAQKMEAVGTMAGGIAHDFNNVITAIKGYTDVALTEVGGADILCEYLKGIDAACSRAARLTNRLLLFSRKNPMQVVPLNMNEVVENVQQMLRRLLPEDITIEAHLEPDIFIIQADPGKIEQVIINLAVNARDAMPEGGRLTLRTENWTLSEEQCGHITEARPGRYVCLSVSDTGTGIDKEIMPYIFEPFFTTKKAGEGTGLGLSVVYGIVKHHGGWIDVYSEPGQGSTFKVHLPAMRGNPEGKDNETVLPEQIRGSGERILLVEDDRGVREFLSEALSDGGYVVCEAATAGDALKVFDSQKGDFHLLFVDVVLPDMSGLQLVDQIHSRSPELPVLLGSGYLSSEQKSFMHETQFQMLQKPYTLEELVRAVRTATQTTKSKPA